jgi:hypothetical protein
MKRIKGGRRLQADADVLNEGNKVRDERRSTASHKCKDGWLDLWVTSLTLGPTISALPNRGRHDPCRNEKDRQRL